jgi:hypothetical protein
LGRSLDRDALIAQHFLTEGDPPFKDKGPDVLCELAPSAVGLAIAKMHERHGESRVQVV